MHAYALELIMSDEIVVFSVLFTLTGLSSSATHTKTELILVLFLKHTDKSALIVNRWTHQSLNNFRNITLPTPEAPEITSGCNWAGLVEQNIDLFTKMLLSERCTVFITIDEKEVRSEVDSTGIIRWLQYNESTNILID